MRESPFRWGMLDYENPFDSWMDLPADDATKDQQDVRRAWAELAGDGRSPVDWTGDATRFRLSQGVGQVILDAARLSNEALRRRAAPAATP